MYSKYLETIGKILKHFIMYTLILGCLSNCTHNRVIQKLQSIKLNPIPWEVTECKAKYLKRHEKRYKNRLTVKYEYDKFGDEDTSNQLRCIISSTFSEQIIKNDYLSINLIFITPHNQEGLIYSLSKPNKKGESLLSAIVISQIEKEQYRYKLLSYKGPFTRFTEIFGKGSIYVEHKYKIIEKQSKVTIEQVNNFYKSLLR